MQLLLVTDIFGDGPWLNPLRAVFPAGQVRCLSPYTDKMDFIDEQHAYQSFMQLCDHECYQDRVSAYIRDLTEETLIVAFSAGASACWRALAEYQGKQISHFIGFYPGQIRHALHLTPKVDTTLVFPCHEAHFALAPVMQSLAGRDRIQLMQMEWMHGFMNPCSMGYAPAGEKAGLALIEGRLSLSSGK